MKRVTFIGDPAGGGDPPSVFLWGVLFTKGIPVETDDPHIIAKAMGNSHFDVRGKPGRKRKDDGENGE